MSCTEIFKIAENGDVTEYATAPNSHHGAMFIWNTLAWKYCGMNNFPLFNDKGEMKKVWDLAKDPGVSRDDRIILASTFDGVMFRSDALWELSAIFKRFERAHASPRSGSNLVIQAKTLRILAADDDSIGACWNQTSVNCDPWSGREEEETGEWIPYNINNPPDWWPCWWFEYSFIETDGKQP